MNEEKDTVNEARSVGEDEKPAGRATPPQARIPMSKAAQNTSDLITGNIIINRKVRRWYPLALWCCVLIFVYIAHHFNYQRLQRLEIQKRMELHEERSRAVVFSSMRMNSQRHSRIVDEVIRRSLPLEESQTPPKSMKKGK